VRRRWQAGRGLVGFIGVLWFAVKPPAPPEAPVDLHPMAMILVVIGVARFAIGTFA
jgi:hypothetical protein